MMTTRALFQATLKKKLNASLAPNWEEQSLVEKSVSGKWQSKDKAKLWRESIKQHHVLDEERNLKAGEDMLARTCVIEFWKELEQI